MKKGPTREQRLRASLEETAQALDAARRGFDQASDGDLVEFYLYSISALGARHSYLLRQIKEGQGPL